MTYWIIAGLCGFIAFLWAFNAYRRYVAARDARMAEIEAAALNAEEQSKAFERDSRGRFAKRSTN